MITLKPSLKTGVFVKIKLSCKKTGNSTSYILVMEKNYEKKFLEFYDQHADGIFRFCFFRLYNREVAKDITQETFLKTWEYIIKENEIKSIKSLAYKIALNLIIDRARKERPTASLEEMNDWGIEIKDQRKIDKQIETKIEIEKILKAIEKMDPAYQEVIKMRFLNELSPKEISVILGENENVISVRINRGKKLLQNLIKI